MLAGEQGLLLVIHSPECTGSLSRTPWGTVREGRDPVAGWRGGQGLTWAQCRLLWGHLVTVQLILTLKQTQPDFHLATCCRPCFCWVQSCTRHGLSLTCSLLYVVSTKHIHQHLGYVNGTPTLRSSPKEKRPCHLGCLSEDSTGLGCTAVPCTRA